MSYATHVAVPARDLESPPQPRSSRPHDRQHIASEELFRRLLVTNRRFADRRNWPSAVLTIDATHRHGARYCSAWNDPIDAVMASTRETDVIGWIQRHATLGVVLHSLPASGATNSTRLEERIRKALVARAGLELARRFSIRLHVRPAPGTSEEPAVQAEPRLQRGPRYEGLKRAFDIVGSAILLTVLAPLLLLIAALVKVKSPGPALYRQMRIGQMKRPFAMLKFRTMHVDADSTLHKEYVSKFIKSSGAIEQASEKPFFKIVNDPRVTPAGRVLRKTSLDELPQLWNVLRGDMSLVGPRPPLPYEVEQYKPWHLRRVIDAKPGITGLWQVRGRSRTTFEEMVRLDLQYAKTCSLWTDIKILLATPGAVFWGNGAC